MLTSSRASRWKPQEKKSHMFISKHIEIHFFDGTDRRFWSPYAPWCWYIYLQNWVILFGQIFVKHSSTMEIHGASGIQMFLFFSSQKVRSSRSRASASTCRTGCAVWLAWRAPSLGRLGRRTCGGDFHGAYCQPEMARNGDFMASSRPFSWGF